MSNRPTPKEIAEENRKIRMLRVVVDLTTATLAQGEMNAAEAIELIEATRRFALNLFPGKEAVFDLIYRPRFERILRDLLRSN
jgi:hypothetical protein